MRNSDAVEAKRRRSQLTLALFVVAVGLACWTGWLAVSLGPGDHRWHWVSLDVGEVTGIVATALLLRGARFRWACMPAALTGLLFIQDAMLDVASSHGSQPAQVMAAALALGAELPMAWLLARISRRCVGSQPAPPPLRARTTRCAAECGSR